MWPYRKHSPVNNISHRRTVTLHHLNLMYRVLQGRASAHQPNWRFNADANIGHAFDIFMAYVGTLQPSDSGAG